MRKSLSILALLGIALASFAQRAERSYAVTDRDWYAAGESMYLSVFCMDVSRGVALSSLSGVCYVEMASADGVAATGKIALINGRGAGSIQLPKNLPTGNYRLYTYTAYAAQEEGFNPLAGSRIISVYNTLSSARVTDGVTAGTVPSTMQRKESGDLSTQLSSDGRIILTSNTPATVSLSVFRNEDLPSYGAGNMADALAVPVGKQTEDTVPEYDGETLTLRLKGIPEEYVYSNILVSRPGHIGDVYAAPLKGNGEARFFTCNLYGSGDLVVSMEKGAPAFQAEVVDPFLRLGADDLPKLVLSPTQKDAIMRLGIRAQVTGAFDADTLYSPLSVRRIPFASGKPIRYNLDDYTRFASMQEVFVEYLSHIRTKGSKEQLQMQVKCKTGYKETLVFSNNPSLILVDGVPVEDHSLVYKLDPSLVKEIDVYPYSYALGQVYSGVANFITFKGDMGGIRFGDNVKILDYDGVSYPVAFGPVQDDRYPNQRETLLWQPIVNLKAGEPLELPSFDVPEGYVLVVEGLTHDGTPLYFREAF